MKIKCKINNRYLAIIEDSSVTLFDMKKKKEEMRFDKKTVFLAPYIKEFLAKTGVNGADRIDFILDYVPGFIEYNMIVDIGTILLDESNKPIVLTCLLSIEKVKKHFEIQYLVYFGDQKYIKKIVLGYNGLNKFCDAVLYINDFEEDSYKDNEPEYTVYYKADKISLSNTELLINDVAFGRDDILDNLYVHLDRFSHFLEIDKNSWLSTKLLDGNGEIFLKGKNGFVEIKIMEGTETIKINLSNHNFKTMINLIRSFWVIGVNEYLEINLED